MIDEQALEREILTSGYEDATGLWEVVWYLNGVVPEKAEAEKIDLARPMLKSLVKHGKITVSRKDQGTGRELQLTPAEAFAVLDNDANWNTPDRTDGEFRFMNTKKGDEALNKIWAEAHS